MAYMQANTAAADPIGFVSRPESKGIRADQAQDAASSADMPSTDELSSKPFPKPRRSALLRAILSDSDDEANDE